MNCLMQAWEQHQRELYLWLRRRLDSAEDADDMLQDLFLKSLQHSQRFCELESARAWLFKMAHNYLIDYHRKQRDWVDLPETLSALETERPPIESLVQCLPRALHELVADDREVITLCDLQGMPQADYAALKQLALPTAKSRLQRARKRLRQQLETTCQVRFDEAGKVCCFVPRTEK